MIESGRIGHGYEFCDLCGDFTYDFYEFIHVCFNVVFCKKCKIDTRW